MLKTLAKALSVCSAFLHCFTICSSNLKCLLIVTPNNLFFFHFPKSYSAQFFQTSFHASIQIEEHGIYLHVVSYDYSQTIQQPGTDPEILRFFLGGGRSMSATMVGRRKKF